MLRNLENHIAFYCRTRGSYHIWQEKAHSAILLQMRQHDSDTALSHTSSVLCRKIVNKNEDKDYSVTLFWIFEP